MSMMQQMPSAAAAPQRHQQQQQQQHVIPQQQHRVDETQRQRQQQQQQQQSYQFACLYTHQKTQKRKKWSDGRFVLHKFGHGKLYEACPALGSGNPCLAETQLAGPEVTAILRRQQTAIEAEKYLIQLEGPWQEPSRLIGPALSSCSGPVVSTSMKKLLSSKFRKPGAYKPPNPQQQQQQGMLGKRRRGPLQPGELVRQHYGDTATNHMTMPTTTTAHQFPNTNQLPSQIDPHRMPHNQLPSAWDAPVNLPATTIGGGGTTFVPRNNITHGGQQRNQQPTVPQHPPHTGAMTLKNTYNRANGMPMRSPNNNQNAHRQPQQATRRNWFQEASNATGPSQAQETSNSHPPLSNQPLSSSSFQPQQQLVGGPPLPPPRPGPLATGQVLQNAVAPPPSRQQQQQGGPPQRNEFVKNDFDPRNFYGHDEGEEDSSDDEYNTSSNKENPPSTWQLSAAGASVPFCQQPPNTNTRQQNLQPERNNRTSYYNAGQPTKTILPPTMNQDGDKSTSAATQVQDGGGGDGTMTKEDLLDLFGESQSQDDDDDNDDDERGGRDGQSTGNEGHWQGGGSATAANEAPFGTGNPADSTTEAAEFTLPPLDDSSSDSSDDEEN